MLLTSVPMRNEPVTDVPQVDEAGHVDVLSDRDARMLRRLVRRQRTHPHVRPAGQLPRLTTWRPIPRSTVNRKRAVKAAKRARRA